MTRYQYYGRIGLHVVDRGGVFMLLSIQNSIEALDTLKKITNKKNDLFWKDLVKKSKCNSRLSIEDFIEAYDIHVDDYSNNDIKLVHITTSSDECTDIKELGLMNLRDTLAKGCTNLRRFLDQQNVYIDLGNKILKYNFHSYRFDFNQEHYIRVGFKLLIDYNLCGFLCYTHDYDSCIKYCPEIIEDISNLIQQNLVTQWCKEHRPYKIEFKCKYQDLYNPNILYDAFSILKNETTMPILFEA